MRNWIYYGFFLTVESKRELLDKIKKLIDIPDNWRIYAEHCTVIFNDGSRDAESASELCEAFLGMKKVLHVDGIGFSDEAIAVRVLEPTANKISHITIAVAPGSKPVKSNEITNFGEIPLKMKVISLLDVVERK